ncbi:MAG: ABC transporter permease, partial [Gemmataceae bacterium]
MIPIKYNIRNLVVRWKTTLLTALGFLMVVALLVVMLAFVEGLNELARRTGPPGNVIILRDGANDELFSEISRNEDTWLLYENEESVLDCPVQRHGKLVSHEVYSIATQELPPDEPGGRPRYRFLQVRGIDEPEVSGQVHGLKLKAGRWFDQTGREVVMGDGIARTLGKKIGDEFEPRPALKWTIVGILDSRGS